VFEVMSERGRNLLEPVVWCWSVRYSCRPSPASGRTAARSNVLGAQALSSRYGLRVTERTPPL
jgi:hypothetical protein